MVWTRGGTRWVARHPGSRLRRTLRADRARLARPEHAASMPERRRRREHVWQIRFTDRRCVASEMRDQAQVTTRACHYRFLHRFCSAREARRMPSIVGESPSKACVSLGFERWNRVTFKEFAAKINTLLKNHDVKQMPEQNENCVVWKATSQKLEARLSYDADEPQLPMHLGFVDLGGLEGMCDVAPRPTSYSFSLDDRGVQEATSFILKEFGLAISAR
jgi:hypothetical protein